MDLNNIADSEILYRMVKKSDPNGFINGKPTAALFMDKSGASVDRDGGRSEEEIIENFKWRFRKKDDYKTSVKISAQQCRNSDTFPNPIGNHKNPYSACQKALKEYIRQRQTLNNIKDRNALFLSKRGTRIGRRTVEMMVKKYISIAGLDPNK